MVLGRDDGAAACLLGHGQAGAAVPVGQLERVAARGQRQQLVAEPDGEERRFAAKRAHRLDALRADFGVARPVAEQHAVRPVGEDGLGRRVLRVNRDRAAAALQLGEQLGGRAVIQQRYAAARVGRFVKRFFLDADAGDGVADGVAVQRVHIHGRRVGADAGVHRALVAQDGGQAAGIDPADAGDVRLLQIVAERPLRAEVGGRAAELADDHAERVDAAALEVGGDQPAVPDSRKGEQQKLAVIVGVGQGFVAADHRGGEHQLADGVALAADALALENLPVAEQKICVFHKNALPFRGAYALSFISRTITAFCACRRFSASSKISSVCASNTSCVISSPLCAGRQCSTIASGAAARMTSALI